MISASLCLKCSSILLFASSIDFKDLISNENGIKIDAKLFQSSFGKYEY